MSFLFGIGVFAAVLSCQVQEGNAADQPAVAEQAATESGAMEKQEAIVAKGFIYRTVQYKGAEYAYSVFVPPTYTEERAWPVVLALHGSGEVGDDGFFQTHVGIGTTIRKHSKMIQAIVVMPQCRRGQWWQGEMLEMAMKCLEDASVAYRCDPERVYLTGLSMGGAGAWLLASRAPGVFAAVVPICGFWGHPLAPAPEEQLEAAGQNLAKLPIWCFHGALDKNVPIERDREIIHAIEKAGGTVKFTEYPNGEHNVWDQAYGDPELWKWMFAQKRGAATEK